MNRLLAVLLLCAALGGVANAARDSESLPTIKDHTSGMEKHDGFLTYYWDKDEGRIWLEIEEFGEEFLYVSYLSRGLGSNDIGLDRGQISDNAVVYFRRIGPKVLMMQKNYDYRASADDRGQQRAVEESFAQSTLWGFTVSAEQSGRVLVDATDFILRDARDVVGTLKRNGQGRFSLESSRSSIEPERTRNFPRNTEFEALLTYTADTAGYFVRQVAPTPNALTIGQHHSFVRLPEPGFKPRLRDPRCGYFGIDYVDHSAPLSESNEKHFIMRHRLEKTNPGPAPSTVVEPIIYYVDRGAPEPLRSALVEGASWWNEAFTAAGFIDAFRVELMPEDADPLDLRYNTIQWVHRASRGWSYGGAVIDPRTGEALKGHVTLGSLRARQDYLIAEGILGPYGDGAETDPRMRALALARLRQLSCHEVGHTLGLRHNFAASTLGRESVMDYPYPYITLAANGTIDISDAYDVGVGEWDKAAITYGYQEFTEDVNTDSALAAYLDAMYASGLVFASDADARSTGSAHPLAHLWDNGANAVDELNRLMTVRARMLELFSENVLRTGTPLVLLEETLVPIYMYHRYQLQAVPKLVGGVDYRFAVRGGAGDPRVRPVGGPEQRRAVQALLAAIDPSALMLSDKLLNLLPPQTAGYVSRREIFSRRTGQTFDPVAAAESVADIPVRYLLHPQRAARLDIQHAADSDLPGLGEIIDALINSSWKADRQQGLTATLQQTVDNLVLHHLIRLANTGSAPVGVRAIAHGKLTDLAAWLDRQASSTITNQHQVHFQFAANQVQRFLDDPSDFEAYQPVSAPAGSPIGTDLQPYGCSAN